MEFFITILSALLGGYIAKRLKFQPVIGYILSGIAVNSFFPISSFEIEKLAELGLTLLLFSIGLELSINKYGNEFKKITIISLVQVIVTTLVFYIAFKIYGLTMLQSIILGFGFSLSSTAVVVKTLIDNSESETVHGKLMIAWLLVQDLAVIPMMIILPLLNNSGNGSLLIPIVAVLKALTLVVLSVILGRHIVPYLIHKIAILNSRELMVLTSVALSVGTALGVTYFGVSASLGAFIAGFVIAESQENHAVFAETRPLRDLFVALFFVTLGFYVSFDYITSNFLTIISFALFVLLVKIIVVLIINKLSKVKGKTSILSAFGLSQIGEFSFILFSVANMLNILPDNLSSLGVAVSLVTLIVSPFVYKLAIPVWRFLSTKYKLFVTFDRNFDQSSNLSNHIIICGFGRVGGWVGKGLKDLNIDFVVIDLDPNVVKKCLDKGVIAIHGDPVEKEVLKIAGIETAKAVVIAIPDRVTQESLIAHIQTISPNMRIISRVHLDEDYEKMKQLRINRIVQPEFEAAASIIKNILISMGRDQNNINKSIKSMRLSHAKI